MYEFLLKKYQTEPFDKFLFNLAMSYYVKRNDYKSVCDILEKTNWKNEENLYVISCLLKFECAYYRKPGLKVFNRLFDCLEFVSHKFKNPDMEISADTMKRYTLVEILKNCISARKNEFVIKILKYHKSNDLNDRVLELSIASHNITIIEKLAEKMDIFKTYSSYYYDKNPEDIESHFYISIDRYIKLIKLNSISINKMIIKTLSPVLFSKIISHLLIHNENEHSLEWLDKARNNQLNFNLQEVDFKWRDILKNNEINKDKKFSLSTLIIFYDLYNELNKTQNKIKDDGLFNDLITNKIEQGITHNKLNYLLKVQEKFNFEKILYNNDLIYFYFKEPEHSIKLPENNFAHISKSFSYELYFQNRKAIMLFKNYSWESIEQDLKEKKSSPALIKTFMYDHMNLLITEKQEVKKIKI